MHGREERYRPTVLAILVVLVSPIFGQTRTLTVYTKMASSPAHRSKGKRLRRINKRGSSLGTHGRKMRGRRAVLVAETAISCSRKSTSSSTVLVLPSTVQVL